MEGKKTKKKARKCRKYLRVNCLIQSSKVIKIKVKYKNMEKKNRKMENKEQGKKLLNMNKII